jgi:hypothetical protein
MARKKLTTIAVGIHTLKKLESVKKKIGARSFDETVQKLIERAVGVPNSMFGAVPKLRSLTDTEHEEFQRIHYLAKLSVQR